MPQLTIAELQIELEQRVRSAGQGGKTTAEDLRIFLNHLLENIGNSEADGNAVHKTGDETITGKKSFNRPGGGTAADGEIAYFGSGDLAAPDKFFTIVLGKKDVETYFLGINKNSQTGELPPNSAFFSSYSPNGSISFGRGDGNGNPQTTDLFIDSTGKAGLGISSPTARLDVGLASPGSLPSIKTSSDMVLGEGAVLFFKGVYSYGNGGSWIGQRYNENFVSISVSDNRTVFADNGNLGVGTTNPIYRLQIGGGENQNVSAGLGESTAYGAAIWAFRQAPINYTSIGFANGTQTADSVLEALVIQRTGNIGIGITTPFEKLEVAGKIKADAFIGDGSQLTNLPSTGSASGLYVPIGDPAKGNISRGIQDTSNTYGVNHEDNTYERGHYNNVYRDGHYNNRYGANHQNNKYAYYHGGNVYGNDHQNNTYGNELGGSFFLDSLERIIVGNGCSRIVMGAGQAYVTIGDNCSQVEVYSCSGSPGSPFVIPSNTRKAVYRNNQLVTAGSGGVSQQYVDAADAYKANIGTTNVFTHQQQVNDGSGFINNILPSAISIEVTGGENVVLGANNVTFSNPSAVAMYGIDGVMFADGTTQNTAANAQVPIPITESDILNLLDEASSYRWYTITNRTDGADIKAAYLVQLFDINNQKPAIFLTYNPQTISACIYTFDGVGRYISSGKSLINAGDSGVNVGTGDTIDMAAFPSALTVRVYNAGTPVIITNIINHQTDTLRIYGDSNITLQAGNNMFFDAANPIMTFSNTCDFIEFEVLDGVNYYEVNRKNY